MQFFFLDVKNVAYGTLRVAVTRATSRTTTNPMAVWATRTTKKLTPCLVPVAWALCPVWPAPGCWRRPVCRRPHRSLHTCRNTNVRRWPCACHSRWWYLPLDTINQSAPTRMTSTTRWVSISWRAVSATNAIIPRMSNNNSSSNNSPTNNVHPTTIARCQPSAWRSVPLHRTTQNK